MNCQDLHLEFKKTLCTGSARGLIFIGFQANSLQVKDSFRRLEGFVQWVQAMIRRAEAIVQRAVAAVILLSPDDLGCGRRAGMNIELFKYCFQVPLYSVCRDEQLLCNFLVGKTLSQQI